MPIIDQLADCVRLLIIHHGEAMSFLLLMIEEAGLPLPIPGDIILAYNGFLIKRGAISYVSAFTAALVAVLAGSSILYSISSKYGPRLVLKLGAFLHADESKIRFIEEKFKKYGVWVIIIGRHIPGFRIPITIFAGISRVNYKTFIISTFISVIFWIPLYLSVGERLGTKTVRLFHAHPRYFLIALLPYLLFIIYLTYIRLKKTKNKAS